jgi:uncharacterized protein (TIRG00374 family)
MTASGRGRRWLSISIGILFSVLFVWLVVRDVDWGTFSRELNRVNWWWAAAYFVVVSAAHILRLIRWGLTVRVLGPVPWRKVLAVGAVGQLAIFALPARLGELVRPLLVSDAGEVGFGEASATVVVERIVDGLTMSLVLFATVLLLDVALVPPEFLTSGYVAAAVFVGLSVGTLLAALTFRWVRGPIERALSMVSGRLAARVVATLQSFFEGLRLLASLRLFACFVCLTAGIWGLTGVGIWVLFQAFPGAVASLPLIAAFATLSVLVVGIMIPAGPGTVGVFHWAVVFALGMFAIDESVGLLVATLLHLLVASVNVVWGVLGAWWGRISLAQMFSSVRKVEVT